MISRTSFDEGWDFCACQVGAYTSNSEADKYVKEVEAEIQRLIEDIEAQGLNNLPADKLKGYIAEYWHADTYNIEAALNKSVHRAVVNESNLHASVDVSTNFGADYSMKYYATGAKSALNQAKNVIQAYREYIVKSKSAVPMTFEQYLAKYDYTEDINNLLLSVYRGQRRIVPSDQLLDAIDFLKRKIATESVKENVNRRAVLRGYKETLQNIADRISDDDGIESTPLTDAEARTIAELTKEGNFKVDDYGYSLDQVITSKYILREALKTGYTASVITAVLQMAPDIVKSFDYLLKNGYLEKEQLLQLGRKTISVSALGFLRGSIASAITISCVSGKLGPNLKYVAPQTIGALTVLVLDSVKYSISVANKTMDASEMGNILTKEILISSAALAGGTVGQAIAPEFPVMSYMLGSLIGSTLASIGLGISESYLLSYCVDSGFTCFGLVNQDYELPDSILEDMGISLTTVDRVSVDRINVDRVVPKTVKVDRIEYETVDYRIVRRGIIGINRIGYILD